MPRSASVLKENFTPLAKYEAFYTGGKVQLTQDGQFMLCLYNNCLKVIRVATGKVEETIGEKDGDDLATFTLANDDTILITAARHGILRQWNFKEKVVSRVWKSLHTGPVSCMAFDSTSTFLATGGCDSTIKVWDIVHKYCTHNLRGAHGVFSTICFYMDGANSYVIGAADDYKIRVWNLESSQCIAALSGHYSTITCIILNQEKKRMLSSGRDKVVLEWNLDNFSVVKTLPVYECIESLILLPEGLILPDLKVDTNDPHFVTAGEKGVLKIWNLATGKCVYTQENSLISLPDDAESEGQIVITQMSHNTSLNAVCVATYDHNILLYQIQDFSLLKQFIGYNNDILDIKLMGKEDSHLAVATNSCHIKIFELATSSCQLLKGHSDIVVSLDVFPQNSYLLISGSKDNSILVWKMDQESYETCCIYMGYGHTHNVSTVVCSRLKSTFFLSASDDSTLKFWDIPVQKPTIALKMHLAARCTEKAHEKCINSICISSNDKLVATGSQDHTAKVWNTSDLTVVGIMRGHRKGVWCVEFSPVDLVLATSSADETIKLWSLADFSVLKTFQGHSSSVLKVLFLSEGMQLLSSSSDGNIKLWDVKKNECTQTLTSHEDKVWALTVCSNENLVISGAADSSIIVWKDTTKENREERLEKQKEFIFQEQQLSNLIHQKEWLKAFGLAIMLEQPSRAFRIVNEILLETDGYSKLHDLVTKLECGHIEILLKFVVEWNTNSRYYAAAQVILNSILKTYTVEDLLRMPTLHSNLDVLLSYTERHFDRRNRMEESISIIEFACQNMKIANENSLNLKAA